MLVVDEDDDVVEDFTVVVDCLTTLADDELVAEKLELELVEND